MTTIKNDLDIAGKQIQLDDTVITTESNRIIMGRIIKINEKTGSVTVEPLMSTTGGRRRPPIRRCLTRAVHNVYVLSKGDLMFAQLRGYYHNTGQWEIRVPKKKMKDNDQDELPFLAADRPF